MARACKNATAAPLTVCCVDATSSAGELQQLQQWVDTGIVQHWQLNSQPDSSPARPEPARARWWQRRKRQPSQQQDEPGSAGEGRSAESSKDAVHATLLVGLALLRRREADGATPLTEDSAYARIVRYIPALLQDAAVTAADRLAAAYMTDVRNGCDAEAQRAAARLSGGAMLGTESFASDNGRCAPCASNSNSRSTRAASGTLSGSPEAEVPPKLPGAPDGIEVDPIRASAVIGASSAPALLHPKLCTTRALERFRNHVTIAAAVRRNLADILDMYEDRCARRRPVLLATEHAVRSRVSGSGLLSWPPAWHVHLPGISCAATTGLRR